MRELFWQRCRNARGCMAANPLWGAPSAPQRVFRYIVRYRCSRACISAPPRGAKFALGAFRGTDQVPRVTLRPWKPNTFNDITETCDTDAAFADKVGVTCVPSVTASQGDEVRGDSQGANGMEGEEALCIHMDE